MSFFEQAFAVGGGGVGLGSHALDGDMALQRGIFGAVDLAHAAGTESACTIAKRPTSSARESIQHPIGCRWGVFI